MILTKKIPSSEVPIGQIVSCCSCGKKGFSRNGKMVTWDKRPSWEGVYETFFETQFSLEKSFYCIGSSARETIKYYFCPKCILEKLLPFAEQNFGPPEKEKIGNFHDSFPFYEYEPDVQDIMRYS